MADGTSFEIDLNVRGGDTFVSAAAQAGRLADRLEAATAASTAAADAVKVGEASYRAAEKAADGAAKALERVGLQAEQQATKAAKAAAEYGIFSSQYEKASAKLQSLTARQAEAAAKAEAAKAALDAEAASLDKLKAAATAATAAEQAMVKTQEFLKNSAAQLKAGQAAQLQQFLKNSNAEIAATKKAADAKKAAAETAAAAARGTGNLGKAGNELANFGGPLGAIAQKALGAADSLGDLKEALGAGGPYAAAAVAVVALATAVATLSAAAIAGVAAITSWAVQLADGARTAKLLSDGIAGSVSGGRQLDKAIAAIQTRVPATTDELLRMASELRKTGLEGDALAKALEETATKAAILKFGPDFKRQTLSLTTQVERLKSNLSKLFSGLKIETLLKSFKELVDLFDSTSASGKAIKTVFESLFQPLITGVSAWIPRMIGAFIQFEILVLKALIAIKPFGSKILWVAEVFGVLALIVAAMTAGFFVAVITPFAIIIGLAATLVAAIMEVVSTFASLYQTLSGMSLSEIGSAMMQGLANGITGAGAAVLSAITGVVTGAIGAAKGLLGIASPSKVFAEIGGYTAEGMAGGVDAGAGEVQGSLEAMVAPPAPAAGGSPAGSGGGGGINIENLNVTAPGGSDPKAFAEALREALYNLRLQGGMGAA